LLLYVATVSVFVFSFLGVLKLSSPFFWIERWIDLSFVCDITLSFFTAFETNAGLLERRPRQISVHYLRTWFVPDVVSTFPWDLISLIFQGTGKQSLLQLPRYIRLLRVVKIFKLLRAIRLRESFTRMEVYLRLKHGHVRMFWMLVTVLLIAHWFGCIFYFFGAISLPDHDSWITQPGVPTDLYGLYITALYFSVYTVTTIGNGTSSQSAPFPFFHVVSLVTVTHS
jgi:Ion transport protein